jgi:hypothetical protein
MIVVLLATESRPGGGLVNAAPPRVPWAREERAMKAQGTVKGILVEGGDGQEYLLGFRPGSPGPTPTLSRRRADGQFEPVEDVQEASRLIVKQVGISGPHLIGPGWGPHFFLWSAFTEALKALPTVPSWPTWRP